MEKQLMQDLINRFPSAYACLELMLNEKDVPEDYLVLETNRAFEELFGLKKDVISGKKATEVFPCIKSNGFDWLDFFDNAAKSAGGREISRFIDMFECCYKVTAYAPEKMRIIIFLEKVCGPKSREAQMTPPLMWEAIFKEHEAVMLLTEPSGKILHANPAASAFYGYTKEALLNLQVEDLNPLFKIEMERRRRTSQNDRHFLLPHKLKNGNERIMEICSSPVPYGNQTCYFSIIFDVTEREQYKKERFRREELLTMTFQSIGDGVVTTNREGRITSLNKSAQEITGWQDDETKNKKLAEVFQLKNGETGIAVKNPIETLLQTGEITGFTNHTVLVDKQGRSIPVADSASLIRDENGNIHGAVMIFRDVSHEREHQNHILELSCHDSLTGLYNRMFLSENLSSIDTAENLPLSLIIGDVNGLKLTNDAFGHVEGDALLKKVAKSLKESCRKKDIIVRWGGDEFLIILPGTPAGKVKGVARRVQDAFAGHSDGILPISVSLGYAVKESTGENLRDVLKEAEEWMYHKKLLEGKSHRSNIIGTLLSKLDESDIETERHFRRLDAYCRAIGVKMNLSSEEQNELSLFAMLHDIGMVGISQSILKKPGPLTPGEWEKMKRHSEIGYRIVQNTPELAAVSEYILLRHERWDGRGYPKGYKREQIPLLCRIFAVADAYDVITTDKVYKAALGKDKAIAELKRNAGTQFDPEIVKVFTDLIDDHECFASG